MHRVCLIKEFGYFKSKNYGIQRKLKKNLSSKRVHIKPAWIGIKSEKSVYLLFFFEFVVDKLHVKKEIYYKIKKYYF